MVFDNKNQKDIINSELHDSYNIKYVFNNEPINRFKLETKIALSYVWIIFILLAALNHIYEFIKGNHPWNNIFPIFISIITSIIAL